MNKIKIAIYNTKTTDLDFLPLTEDQHALLMWLKNRNLLQNIVIKYIKDFPKDI